MICHFLLFLLSNFYAHLRGFITWVSRGSTGIIPQQKQLTKVVSIYIYILLYIFILSGARSMFSAHDHHGGLGQHPHFPSWLWYDRQQLHPHHGSEWFAHVFSILRYRQHKHGFDIRHWRCVEPTACPGQVSHLLSGSCAIRVGPKAFHPKPQPIGYKPWVAKYS